MSERGRKGDVPIVAGLVSALTLALIVLVYLMLRPSKTSDDPSTSSTATSSAPVQGVAPSFVAPPSLSDATAAQPTASASAADVAAIAPLPTQQQTVVLNHRPTVQELQEMEDPLSTESVREVLQAQHATVRAQCHPAGATAARARVVIHIEPNGKVSQVDADPDGSGDPALTTCLQGLAKAWRFPRNAAPTTVAVPYAFAE